MPRIKAPTLSLDIAGKIIEVKKPSKRNFDLNKALLRPEDFQKFVTDPKSFAAKFDLAIDDDIATTLSAKLDGLTNLNDLKTVLVSPDPFGPVGATLWAVAVGVYSVASTKIAVAF